MPEEITTIEELTVMIKRGFDASATKTDLEKLATKTDLAAVRREVIDRLDTIDKRLDQIDRSLDRIENVVIEDHLHRIQAIEHALGLAARA